MQRELQKLLRPVRSRLTRARAMPRVASALIAGGWLALVGALLTLFGGSSTSGMIAVAVAVALPALALVWSWLRPVTWEETAALVDARLHLHNRASTALHLAQDAGDDAFAALQIENALASLRDAKLKSIRFGLPWQRLAVGGLLTALALGLIGWGIFAPPSDAIVTSGDMQDLRPEIADRARLDVPAMNSDVIEASTRLSSRTSLEAQFDTQQFDGAGTMRGEAGAAYFDALHSNE